jgi:hypothetical protein
MKKIVFGSLLLIGIAVAFSFGSDQRQASQALALGEEGAQRRRAGRSFLESCLKDPGHMRVFCQEGYVAESSVEKIQKGNLSIEDAKIYPLSDPTAREISAVAVGMALGLTGHGIEEVVSQRNILREREFDYLIDGWAFATAGAKGPSWTLRQCTIHLGVSSVPLCLFGIGRSQFFYRFRTEEAIAANPWLQYGFDFARTYTQSSLSEGRLTSSRAGERVAELLKFRYQGRNAKAPPSGFELCAWQKHHVHCCPFGQGDDCP